MKRLPRLTKQDKEQLILFGLIDLYIKTGTAVGSNSLKESGFEYMSSATIRNYFSKLEKKDLLSQQHSSGGRIPTPKAYQLYVKNYLNNPIKDKKSEEQLKKDLDQDSKKVTTYLTTAAEALADITNCAVFQSSPRFDQDFVQDVKLINLEKHKILCVIITEFGLIKTEILHSQKDLDDEMTKKIEDFFLWRLNKKEKPDIQSPLMIKLAQHFYNEVMLRYVMGYSNILLEDIYKTGLSNLLSYPEFKDPSSLAESLSIFENSYQMQAILNKCLEQNSLSCFIADELEQFEIETNSLSIICIPYYINQMPIGAIAILCPIRISYKHIFAILKKYSELTSDSLSKSISKYKITFRKPTSALNTKQLEDYNRSILLEDKSQ